MGDFLIILTVAFTAYLSAVMVRRISSVVLKKTYRKIFLYELAVCFLLLILALDLRSGFLTSTRPGPLRSLGRAARCFLMGFAAVIVFFFVRIAAAGLKRTAKRADYAIVLGLALENGKPTADLLSRLAAARRYLEEYPDTTLILTGGNPDASGRTEAAVMRELLLAQGVPEEKLLLEDRAETAKENCQNTARLIDADRPVVLITSDYHMYRALQTAESAGFARVMGVAAPSSWLYFGANVLWEVMLELNELTLKKSGP